ncbi:DUF2508 family protein [Tepidimicrobium xylanilyticum]|uniref:DUF2508 domain-containing protein n=1 Tax=Tepidimicrobium xylanilyticum TaxID=1123352 RepID=A0A1H2WNJ5_9FIRM|nr:DUF2508 family protein [Tepidimicrobium xylanilyticum]GMG95199.1 hypothetical protein EN5CB1_00250 [Tepidimicrobium xylanilyticum]SDW81844.1 Protein of unknown function [Tepidimicrobium xylanilyticum]
MDRPKSYYKEKTYRILEYVDILSNKIKGRKKTEEEKMMENLKRAHEEWKNKEIYFQWVTDPDLVDHAIYELEASKIKYIYLLKKVRERNIR